MGYARNPLSFLSRLPSIYEHLMELPERAGLWRLRKETLAGVSGNVLEIGAGRGMNARLHDPGVERLTLTEPDEERLDRARGRAAEAPFPVEYLSTPAEALPFKDASFDAVVATLVFCTVEDPARSLSEIRRVLKEGGELRLLEHVHMEREPFGKAQEVVTPLWKHVAGGCHLDRDTLTRVREAGFTVERVDRYLDGLLLRIFARN
jgi:ubiquinone/menaquinone biosynthesis C-methylase UbiE